MSSDVQERLPEYVLGTLSPAEMQEMDDLVAASPALRREVDALTEVLASETAARLHPVEPSPGLRARLLSSLDSPARFAPFCAELGRLFDLSEQAIRAVLARVDDAAAWLTFAPGITYQHFPPGPRLAAVPGAEAGLVKVAPGQTFFRHRHTGGPEMTFVLQGTMRDGDRRFGPGNLIRREQGTVHDYQSVGDDDLVIAVLHHGIQPES
jgi:quercetin dioxygenase-like cupin family protein